MYMANAEKPEPDPAEMPQRYGDTVTVLDWRDRLVCSRCGGREIDMVVSGTKRFRRKQQLHFLRHRYADCNYAVVDNFWDWLLGTYRSIDAGRET